MAEELADKMPTAISVISAPPTANANPEGEMDALLLGRTRVSLTPLNYLLYV